MIDTYYRIKSLHDLGVRIHLHCFEYGRQNHKELETLCETVNYYPRKSGLLRHFSGVPYIVVSRKSKTLLNNLISSDSPIFFDGIHSTYNINHPALANRIKLVRMHNIEHLYYKSLANREPLLIRKFYFALESLKLKWYEKVLEKSNYVLTVSDIDQEHFNNNYHNAILIPSFHPFKEPESLPGFGEYILFHGDLSINENVATSDFLISEVFSKIPYHCIIAGKNPPEVLFSYASKHANIQIISNPDNIEMMDLIRNAHINTIPAMTTNGLKLKLLYALYAGRHCLVNTAMTRGNRLGNLCDIANSGEEMIEKINTLMDKPFTNEMILKRNEILSVYYNNIENVKKILSLIAEH